MQRATASKEEHRLCLNCVFHIKVGKKNGNFVVKEVKPHNCSWGAKHPYSMRVAHKSTATRQAKRATSVRNPELQRFAQDALALHKYPTKGIKAATRCSLAAATRAANRARTQLAGSPHQQPKMALQLAESIKRANAASGTRESFHLYSTQTDGARAMYGCTWGPPYSGTGKGTVWPHLRKVFAADAAHGTLPCKTTMTVFSMWGYTCDNNLVLIFYGCFLDNENSSTWEKFMRDCFEHQPDIANATIIADGDKGFAAALDAVFRNPNSGPKRFFCALHLEKNVNSHLGNNVARCYRDCTNAVNIDTLRPLLDKLKDAVKEANERRKERGKDPYTGLDKREAKLYPAATFAKDGFGPPQTFGYTSSQGAESANNMIKKYRQMYPITGLLGVMKHEVTRHIRLREKAMAIRQADASGVLPKHKYTIDEMVRKLDKESYLRVREHRAIGVDRRYIYHVESASDPTVVYMTKLGGTCTCGSGFQRYSAHLKFSTGNCKHEVAIMLKLQLPMRNVVPSWRTVDEHVKFYVTMCLRSPAVDLASIEVDASGITWGVYHAKQKCRMKRKGRISAHKRKRSMQEQAHDKAVAKRAQGLAREARRGAKHCE